MYIGLIYTLSRDCGESNDSYANTAQCSGLMLEGEVGEEVAFWTFTSLYKSLRAKLKSLCKFEKCSANLWNHSSRAVNFTMSRKYFVKAYNRVQNIVSFHLLLVKICLESVKQRVNPINCAKKMKPPYLYIKVNNLYLLVISENRPKVHILWSVFADLKFLFHQFSLFQLGYYVSEA